MQLEFKFMYLDGLKPATKDDLIYKRGIVYYIENQYDKKGYVGKSINTFTKRYSGGKWWENRKNVPSNILLDRTVKKYGHEQFKVFILEEGIADKNLIRNREKYWARALNTYAPHGYNIKECGDGGEFYGPIGEKSKEKMRQSHLEIYEVRHLKTNETIIINDLPQWCKNNNINCNAFRNLLCGLILTSQGYCLSKTTKKQLNKPPSNCKKYVIQEIKTGAIIQLDNLPKFCKENNLDQSALRNMTRGYFKTSQGYCLVNTDIKYKNRATTINLINPQGKLITVTNVAKFCKENNLDPAAIYRLRKGIWKSTKGYTLSVST